MKNSHIYALLVSVGDYTKQNLINLPTYKMDAAMIGTALACGLKVPEEQIRILSKEPFITIKSFAKAISEFAKKLKDNDTFILYFSGHGTSDGILFSDGVLSLQGMIDFIDTLPAANKIFIIDACFSGGFSTNGAKEMTANMDFSEFVGKGIAVMAACAANETAKLGANGNHSLYTGIVCTAMLSKDIVKRGYISLNDLNEEIRILMESWTKKNQTIDQHIIYRTSMGGTIYFQVEDYHPYKPKSICYDKKDYKVCKVKPLSSSKYKRLAAFVMLKKDADIKEVAKYTKEIAKIIKEESVYSSKNEELRFGKTDARAVWCYFGKDYSDMIRHVFVCHSIWAADKEMKQLYFKENERAVIKKGIYIWKNTDYELIRKIQSAEMTEQEYIKNAKELISEIVSLGEQFCTDLEEVCNKTISLQNVSDTYGEWVKKVTEKYLIVTDCDIPPIQLQKWSDKILDLAGWVLDMAVLLRGKNNSKEMTEREMWLLKNSVGRYYDCMEELKKIERG